MSQKRKGKDERGGRNWKSFHGSVNLGKIFVAQLIARSLPIPEDPGSNPVVGNIYWTYLLLTICREDEK